jgi:hypothetical protein
VPTPDKVLGHISGAPNYLPYSADVYRYFRALAAASPRVKVFSIGKTEEGREMIAVAIADENLLADLDANKARLAKLADPRSIGMDDATADQADRAVDAGLLHHRHHPLHRNRRAHRADGAGLSPRRGRRAVHQAHPLARDHADHAGRRSRRPRPHGRSLQLASGAPRPERRRR